MKVKSLDAMLAQFGLPGGDPVVESLLFYIAVGEESSEYNFDFVGAALYDFFRDRKVSVPAKVAMLHALECVMVHDGDHHRWRLTSPNRPVFGEWREASRALSASSAANDTQAPGREIH